MKKIYVPFVLTAFILCATILSCATTSADSEPLIEHVETEMRLPDDSFGDITFFKKWHDAGKFWNTSKASIQSNENMASGGSRRVYSDDKLGIGNVIHSANESKAIRKIFDVMKKYDVKYGISVVDYNDGRVRLYTFTYFPKGKNLNSASGELRSDFLDFIGPNHLFYLALVANDTKAMDKVDNWNRDILTERLLSELAVKNGKDSDEFKTALYKARHTPKTVYRYPGQILLDTVKVYLIYDDDGNCYSTRKPGFVIDENGNFRTYDSYEYDKCEIVLKENIPDEVKTAAQKSLQK